MPFIQNKENLLFRFSRINSFWYGITLPFQSSRLILTQPKLLAWSTVPILIALLIYYYLFSSLDSQALIWIDSILTRFGLVNIQWIHTLLTFLARMILFVFSALTFSFVSSIAACPFNDFLAENTETFSSLPSVPKSTLLTKVKLIGIDIIKTTVAILANISLLLLSWVPGVSLVTIFAAALLLCFQFISYPQTRRGQGILYGITFIWKHLYACLGFGLVITFLFSIPVISSFALPIAVVGGTLLVGRAHENSVLK